MGMWNGKNRSWRYFNTTFFWYEYPRDYVVRGEIIEKTHIEILDRKHPYVCPHCNSNHCSLQREGADLYCFVCGWRDGEHYKTPMYVPKLNKGENLNNFNSLKDDGFKGYYEKYNSSNYRTPEEAKAYNQQYRIEHSDEIKAQRHQKYYQGWLDRLDVELERRAAKRVLTN